MELAYTPLERLVVSRPVDRIAYVSEHCRDKRVLDLGCLDETAAVKEGTNFWLHGVLGRVARSVLGIDNSERLSGGGLQTGPTSSIVRGDITDADSLTRATKGVDIDVIVAGELIEHLPDTARFFSTLRRVFPGRELIATTPNATSFTNVMLATVKRESNHVDHLHAYSLKTLNTLCQRAGFAEWTLTPYHTAYPEMALRVGGIKGRFVQGVEKIINAAEHVFPMLSGGWILHVHRI